MSGSAGNDSRRSWGVTFFAQKVLHQPMLWLWLMFSTHFGWQLQKRTWQVKQIYLACFVVLSEPALKLLSMQLPIFVCDFVTSITERVPSIYLYIGLALINTAFGQIYDFTWFYHPESVVFLRPRQMNKKDFQRVYETCEISCFYTFELVFVHLLCVFL